MASSVPSFDEEDFEDLEDAPDDEHERTENEVLDQATAAHTIEELKIEIATLKRLESLALAVLRGGQDMKWKQLASLLQEIFTPDAVRGVADSAVAYGDRVKPKPEPSAHQKLVIFTEHRDTLNYLQRKIQTLLGRAEAVVCIHGGMGRKDRLNTQEAFKHDPTVQVLLATDAAGEGINLQRAHLMVNYDLPWNPNRLEQRFGRIHRIGQTEVCHLWNLVADETREGDVFRRLFEKLEVERQALSGAVFDVLGQVLQGRALRDLLVEAVRYGEDPEVRARLEKRVDDAFDREQLRHLLAERALSQETLEPGRVREIREEMERAEARRLQPHFISSFFREAFEHLGGTIREREAGRYQISYIPGLIRSRDRQIGAGAPIARKYERIAFEKSLVNLPGRPRAEFIAPGHPLLEATTDLILERYRSLLRRGAVLVDPTDPGTEVRALVYLEHSVEDGRVDRAGAARVISRQMQFVEIDASGTVLPAGHAPYLDYRPLTEAEHDAVAPALEAEWLTGDLERQAMDYAIANLAPQHFAEVRRRKEELISKTISAVKDRLTKEITHWDSRALELKAQEEAGRQPRMNWQKARERADELEARLQRRLAELEQERRLSPRPPAVVGGALIVPAGLLAELEGEEAPEQSVDAARRRRIELLAMGAVMSAERALGHEPRDVSAAKVGYDIESRDPETERLRFIEVKGRVAGAETVTVTRNEILTALNKPEDFILALVLVDGEETTVRYVREPFAAEPDFGATSVNYGLRELWARGVEPGVVAEVVGD